MNCSLKLFSNRWNNIQEASGYPIAPNTALTIRQIVCNSFVEYPSWEYEFDTKGSMVQDQLNILKV